jgi:hypothetical protein
MKLSEITKAVAGALTAGGAAFTTAAIDGDVTGTEWATVVVAALIALGAVWAVTAPALKAIVGAIVGAVTAWSAAYSDSAVTAVEWISIALGAAAALALVGVVENEPPVEGRHEV